MTKKDFVLIANVVKELRVSALDRWYIAKAFADELGETNPKFDRDRFINACGA